VGAAAGDDGRAGPGAPPDDLVATGAADAPGAHDVVDTPAEVEAAAATQRRSALGYALVFLSVTGAVPVLTLTLPWWSESRLAGGLSPNFLVAGIGLYVFFLALGVAAATLASSIEARMLGGPGSTDPP
jgi:hypothetical protein